jgi:DNA-binding response OmpR family regulator
MSARILVVDDDDAIRTMLGICLKKQGYIVEEAEGVRTAQSLLELNDYEIILLDKNMTGLNNNPEGGMDLLRYVRSRCMGSEVIMITGLATIETAIAAMKLGAFDYIQKPFNMDQLQQKISRLLEYRKCINYELILDTYRTTRLNILELIKLHTNKTSDELIEDTITALNSILDKPFKMFKDIEKIVLIMRESLTEIACKAESLRIDMSNSNSSKALIESICHAANNNI